MYELEKKDYILYLVIFCIGCSYVLFPPL